MAISGSSFLVAHIQCQENAVEIGHINYNIIYITLCSVVLTNNKWTITFLPFYGCNHLTLTFNNRFAKITELLSRMMAEPAQHQKLSQQFNCTYKTALKGITLCTSITTVTIINNAFFWWKIILTSHHRWHPHGLGGKGFIMGDGIFKTRMWANAQGDGRPVEYRWRLLFNATKFGWRPLLEYRAVTLPRRGAPKW